MKKEYEELLNRAEKEFDTFSLVWRDQLKYDNSASDIEKELLPYLVRTERTNEWPGTKLEGSMATVRWYTVTPESVSILRSGENSFDWLGPSHPEDLAFYKGGRLVYGSIAHERDEWYPEG
jgi:hypothetical protein